MPKNTLPACHGIDLSAPWGVEALLELHRGVYGHARMENDGDGPETPPSDGDGETPPDPPADGEQQLGDPGKRALSAERRRAAAEKKRADDAERELQDLRRSQMSDQEKVAAERDDWRSKYEEQSATLAERELAILRTEIATEKGLSLAQARRLIGSTREDLEADADAFKAELPAAPQSPFPPNTPKPDPSQGPSGSQGGRATSVADAMAEYAARTKRATT